MIAHKVLTTALTILLAMATLAIGAEPRWVSPVGVIGPEVPQATLLTANEYEAIVAFSVPGFLVENVSANNETYQSLRLPGYATTLEIGKPELPAITVLVAIPSNSGVAVEVVSRTDHSLPDYYVYPFQTPVHEREQPTGFDYDIDVYAQAAVYPDAAVQVGEPAIWRDLRVVKLTVYPIRYTPVSGNLTVCTDITVRLEFSGTSDVNALEPSGHAISEAYDNMYRRTVLNYGWTDLGKAGSRPSKALSPDYDYLIIAVDGYVDNLTSLVNWKNSQGLSTQVTPLSTVGSSVSEIKDYITQEYTTHGIQYCLLVGNEDDIPGYTGWSCFSDYYYALVSGGDDYPDIAVGRFCVHSEADVDLMVSKSVAYENNPPAGDWLDNTLLVAHKELAPGKYQGCKENIRTATYSWQQPEFSTAYGADTTVGGDRASDADVRAAIDAGQRLVNYRGHGDVDCWITWNVFNESFNNSDVALLNNGDLKPVVFSIACWNANLESSSMCLGEAFTLDDQAAAAFLGASRPSYTTANHTYDERLFDAIFDDTVNVVGDASNLAAIDIINQHGIYGLENARMYLWLGDPTLHPVAVGGPPPPIADFSASPRDGCIPLTVTFTDESTGDITSWSWDFGDDSTSTEQNPTHTYSSSGSYTVSLTVSGPTGVDTETKINYIVAREVPTAGFTATPTSGCVPVTVSFTDQSGGFPDAWTWDFGDDGTSSEQNPQHTYTSPGIYTVSLTASNVCGIDSHTKVDYVEVELCPIALALSDIPVAGTVTGDYTYTHASDDSREVIEEVLSTSHPRKVWSYLEHKWDFDVPAGDTITFYVEAYRTLNSEGDNFAFEYSMDDNNYWPMVTVTSSSEYTYSAELPNTVSGTVWVRVIDTDHTRGNTSLDRVYVDYMYFESTGEPPPPDTLWVYSIDVTRIGGKANKYQGQAVVVVHDQDGNPVQGAVVNGHFTGPSNDYVSGTTVINGSVTLTSSQVKGPSGIWCFYVDDISRGNDIYDPSRNNESYDCEAAAKLSDALTADRFELDQNYPNPFNPTTEISFSVGPASHVTLTVYNVMGQRVATLVNEHLEAGPHTARWDAGDMASGVYFYRMEAADFVRTNKMILLK